MKIKFLNKYIRGSGEYALLVFTFIAITILSQVFLVPNLPAKYFYDSEAILSITNGQASHFFDDSYLFTGNFFNIFNVFNFTTFSQWACLLSFIGLIISFCYFKSYKKIELHKLLLIFATMVFLNIYVFRIGKDFIQWLFWLSVYLALLIKSPRKKTLVITALFIVESLFFRSYYIGIYLAFIGIKYLIKRQTKNDQKLSYFKLFSLAVIGICVGLLLLQSLSPDLYSNIINVRTSVNSHRLESADANTMIVDIFDSNNTILYICNLVLNFFRLVFPIELLTKGAIYIPFVIFQLYLSISILAKLRQVNQEKDNFLTTTLSLFLAFLLISSIFEPDFGSFIRHEISVMPIYLAIVLNNNRKKVAP